MGSFSTSYYLYCVVGLTSQSGCILSIISYSVVSNLFQKDLKLIEEFITDKVAEIELKVNTDVDLVLEVLEQLWKLMEFEKNGTSSKVVDFLKFCSGIGTLPPSPAE